ncbi:MAG TPA: S49 family peptidase [Tepidisphaeraceae bacterium]|nr:S49 family peptidase [Tepidisphaeraceae bacterium]
MNKLINGSLWAMHEPALMAMAEAELPQQAQAEPQEREPYQVIGGVAVMTLVGLVAKYDDIYLEYFGGTATTELLKNLSTALDDESVKAICIYVDSPGGEVSGTDQLAQAVAAANKRKPVTAYISDLGASAAYWVASQAGQVFANRTAFVGSIGVYTVMYDTSTLYEKAGIVPKLVKAGSQKGTGVEGLPISDEQLADVQRTIDNVYTLFVEAVATGRGMSEGDALNVATGQVWVASDALKMGLIDGIDTVENVIRKLSGNDVKEIIKMPENELTSDELAKAKASVEVEVAVTVEDDEHDDEDEKENEDQEAEQDEDDEAKASIETKIKAAATDAYAEAQRHEQERFKALVSLCKDRPSFAVEQYIKGHDLGKATAEYAALLKNENDSLRGGVSVGAEPVAIAPKRDGVASTREEFEREWDASTELQKQFGSKANYASYKLYELNK